MTTCLGMFFELGAWAGTAGLVGGVVVIGGCGGV